MNTHLDNILDLEKEIFVSCHPITATIILWKIKMWTLLVVLARAKDVRPPQKLENTSGEHLRHCLEHTRNSSQTGMADALLCSHLDLLS